MPKKATKKKSVKKKNSAKKSKTPKKRISSQSVEIKMQPVLVENFIALQKVMVTLSTKFENLHNQISKLLDLFEMSAKTLAKKDFNINGSNEEVTQKLNELTEQNKVLAKGLTMIHEDEQKPQILPPALPPIVPPIIAPKVAPKPLPATPNPPQKTETENYQKSTPEITSPKK